MDSLVGVPATMENLLGHTDDLGGPHTPEDYARRPADVGMDDLTPVTSDYPAHDNEFTGTIHEIVVGVGPMGEAFDPPLEMARPRRRPAPRRRRSAAGCPAVHSRD